MYVYYILYILHIIYIYVCIYMYIYICIYICVCVCVYMVVTYMVEVYWYNDDIFFMGSWRRFFRTIIETLNALMPVTHLSNLLRNGQKKK